MIGGFEFAERQWGLREGKCPNCMLIVESISALIANIHLQIPTRLKLLERQRLVISE